MPLQVHSAPFTDPIMSLERLPVTGLLAASFTLWLGNGFGKWGVSREEREKSQGIFFLGTGLAASSGLGATLVSGSCIPSWVSGLLSLLQVGGNCGNGPWATGTSLLVLCHPCFS